MKSKHNQFAKLSTYAGINAYNQAGANLKEQFHKLGKAFLKDLAKLLGPDIGEYTVSSNKAGIAVLGEVTLHADNLYVQLHDSFNGNGISALYRSCTSQKDYHGGPNNHANMPDFFNNETSQERVLESMRKLARLEKSRKKADACAPA